MQQGYWSHMLKMENVFDTTNFLIAKKSKMLFNDAYISMKGGVNEHMNIGAIMSKYIERMSKSNDQILKLAELIAKEEEKDEAISEDEIFGKING